MSYIYMDIETGPAPNCLEHLETPEAPANYKDAAKIAEYVKNARAKQLADAALSPITGRVLVAGIQVGSTKPTLYEGEEANLLVEFWRDYRALRAQKSPLDWVTFNGANFDWPFLVRRSWVYGIRPPPICNGRGYPLEHLIDLRQRWQLGDRQAQGGLGVICKLLGLGEKTGEGAEFAAIYESDRPKALAYLVNDLELLRRLAERIL
jgi:hypothetical protein